MTNTLDPRIGILNSGEHYAFVNGYSQPEFRGTREAVEEQLWLRATQAVRPSIAKASSKKTSSLEAATRKKHLSPKKLYEYEVTVTPTVVSYAGHTILDAYLLTVYAATNAAAISAARKQRRESEGRYAVPASYSAKRVVA